MSELALTLIAQNRQSKDPFLDLGNCGLKEVPAEVSELTWLKGINFREQWPEWDGINWQEKDSGNKGAVNGRFPSLERLRPLVRLAMLSLQGVESLDGLSELTSLEVLLLGDVSGCSAAALSSLVRVRFLGAWNLHDLLPLSNLLRLEFLVVVKSKVSDLTPLAGLSALQILHVWGTQVSDLTPLSGLSALQKLDVSQTPVNDLRPLSGLSALQTLDVSQTQVSDLTPLTGLSALHTLDVSQTQVSDLTPLSGLSALQMLNVSSTQVSDLTPLRGLSALQSLDVSSTKVSDLTPLASLSALQSLNVWETQVSELTPLTGLSALHTLDVRGTQVSDLTPLTGLSALQTLDVSSTQVSDLTPLAGLSALQTLDVWQTQVSDLTPLAGLSALQTLDVSNTQVSDLTPLAGLSALQSLLLSNTQVSDLTPLSGLYALQRLSMRVTQVRDLTPLSGLSALQSLNMSSTQASDLTPLANLSALHTLNVSDTQINTLLPIISLMRQGIPVLWSSAWWRGSGIYVEDCPLVDPPPEIVQQGNEAILNYFAEKAAGEVDHLYEAKMLILGEGGAGKTSLLRRLYQRDQPLPSENETTRGINIHRHDFDLKNGRRFRLNVWDFGGQEIYHATHQFFLTRRSLYVLLDDTRKEHKSVSDEGFKYWLELIDVFSQHSPTVIFQNEKGGRSKTIDLAGIKQRFDNVKELYSGNLEVAGAADKLQADIEFFAAHLSHIGEELPARWLKVRADIELRAAEVAYISDKEYYEIYNRHLPPDRKKALHLSRYLHDLGVFLHFQDDPLLVRTVILQNEWATEAVFRILDDELVKAKFGRFDESDCERLWLDSAYAGMHLELLALMKRFELCYELRDYQPPVWLAPQLLPPARPLALGDWKAPDDLTLRYNYAFLPKGIVSRLTVRLHRFVVDPEMAWVTGVLFKRNNTLALVEVLPSGDQLQVRARGFERKELLSVVTAELDALNDSFAGLRDKIDKLVPCNCAHCGAAETPHFFSQKELARRKEHAKLKVECPVSFADVDVLQLLDGIRLDSLPGWAKEEAAAPLRIFLASSSELREDRDEFDRYFSRLRLRRQLDIVRWEDFLDAMSPTRLQDEYNKEIQKCDIFVCLFFTKTGKFTEEEFDTAYRRFQATGKPQIFTYFKDSAITTGTARKGDLNSLWAFQEKLNEKGHFPTSYQNLEGLKLHFSDQLEKLLSERG